MKMEDENEEQAGRDGVMLPSRNPIQSHGRSFPSVLAPSLFSFSSSILIFDPHFHFRSSFSFSILIVSLIQPAGDPARPPWRARCHDSSAAGQAERRA